MAQVYDKIVLRNGTEAQWIAANPVLLEGEVGITMDTTPKKFKIGNGVSAWDALIYEESTMDISDISGLQDILNLKANIANVYNKIEINNFLALKQDINSYINGGEF
jgi:hypothetical protein